MKVWGRGVLLTALATVLLVPPSAAAPVALAAKHKPKGLTLSSFSLKGSHGYKLQVGSYREGSGPVTAAVIAKRGDLSATYETTGQGGLGIHTNLGSVGRVEVHFQRNKRSVERISKRCHFIVETGIFRGEIEFDGEGGYTHAAARSARGDVLRLPDGFCLFENLKSPALPSFLDTTTLSARSRTANGSIELEASRLSIGKDLNATATLREKVGAVKISRSARVDVSKRALRIRR